MNTNLVFFAATLGAHAIHFETGFRQKDVRFLVELFLNWMNSKSTVESQALHNTQIMRHLERAAHEGLVKKQIKKGKQPWYRLNRGGLIEMARALTKKEIDPFNSMGDFYFSYQFIVNYKLRIRELIQDETMVLPRAIILELEQIFDESHYLSETIRSLELELKTLKIRINDSEKTTSLYREMKKHGKDQKEIFSAIDKNYPYELHNQKRLSELLAEFPIAMAEWELGQANTNRIEMMWKPRAQILEYHLKLLKSMRQEK
jgi:hypothetical protein